MKINIDVPLKEQQRWCPFRHEPMVIQDWYNGGSGQHYYEISPKCIGELCMAFVVSEWSRQGCCGMTKEPL